MSKRILILSANPEGTSPLDLDIEKREIRQALKGSEFIIETREAVRPADLQQALLEVKPQIVHFCGHGEVTEGIVLVNDDGNIEFATTSALANLFKIFQDSIECIVLNACYTEVQATAIFQHINYVVGMNRSILDESAIIFARGFYGALAEKAEIETAYDLGKIAIELEYPDQETIQRKLVTILDGREDELPTLEYLIPVLIQKEPNPDSTSSTRNRTQLCQGCFSIPHRLFGFGKSDRILISGGKDSTIKL